MSVPLKTAEEIATIISRGQHAIADIGLSLVRQSKRGVNQSDTNFRDQMYRLILLRIYLQNILDDDAAVEAYYEDPDNEQKFNKLLDAIARLSQFYGSAAIPILGGKRIPLSYYPSTAGSSGAPSTGGPAVPGGVTFQNLNVQTPGEVVDTMDASSSEYAFYIINIRGTGVGEGSRLDILGVNWRGAGTPVITNYRGDDVGGTVGDGVTYSAAIVDGQMELTCNVPTSGWLVRGSRISFENISFQNAQGPLPAGGIEGQYLRKSSVQDYDAEFATILMSEVDGLVAQFAAIAASTAASLAEKLSRDGSIPMTGNLPAGGFKLTGLAAGAAPGESLRYEQVIGVFLLLAGGAMTGNIAMGGNKVTGLGAAANPGEALRYEQLINMYLLLTGGTMSGDIAMGGNKVTGLAAATNPGEAVRYEQLPTGLPPTGSAGGDLTGSYPDPTLAVARVKSVGVQLLMEVFPIGAWNMDSTSTIGIAHGLGDQNRIRGVSATIMRDDNSESYEIRGARNNGALFGGILFDNTNVYLDRVTGGFFDSTVFNDGVINRGWLTITYEA